MTTTQIAASVGRLHLLVTFDPKEVGRRIAAARDRKGWTQLEFALAAKVSPSSVSRWERGLLPPVRELMRIANVLGIDVAELIEEQVEQNHDALIVARLDQIIVMLESMRREQDDPPMPRSASA